MSRPRFLHAQRRPDTRSTYRRNPVAKIAVVLVALCWLALGALVFVLVFDPASLGRFLATIASGFHEKQSAAPSSIGRG